MCTSGSPTWRPNGGQAANSRRPDLGPSWAALRPVLVGFLLVADVFTVAALATARPAGWFPPFVAFTIALLGLIGLELWALTHRHDDES